MPTPMPVWIQKIRLSISPGSSPPKAFSRIGVNHGSYSSPLISETTSLPTSSEPPNSATKEVEVVEVPLLGKITAGSPIEAIQNPGEYFALPAYLIPKNKEVFTLKVSGESMINAGILDGDIVIVERQNTARNGQIVVAMTEENEVTLKTFYKESNYFRLQPENDTMDPIILNQVSILGIAIGLYRKL